jgi:nucleoside recognition membrane protein YjiH
MDSPIETVLKTVNDIFQSTNHIISAPANWITNWIKDMMKTLYFYLAVIVVILLSIIFIYCAIQYYCASTANKCWPIMNIFEFPMNMFKCPTVMLSKKRTKNRTFQGPPAILPYVIPMHNGNRKN